MTEMHMKESKITFFFTISGRIVWEGKKGKGMGGLVGGRGGCGG